MKKILVSKLGPAMTVSIASVMVNIVLSAMKLAAGVIGHSQAMIADAIHSASDVLSTLIVMAGLLIAHRAADESHEYGHGKFESLASLLLAEALLFTGLKIGWDSLRNIVSGAYLTSALPGVMTAVAAVVSIVTKEAMYRVTVRIGRCEHSDALIADAWHHRSDALSSIGSLAGIVCARLGLPVMDPLAGLVICVLIVKTAVEILLSAVRNLTDGAGDPELEQELCECALQVHGVRRVDLLKTRCFGSGYYVDMEIAVDGDLSLNDAHSIAAAVHDRVESSFERIQHCMIHVNPEAENHGRPVIPVRRHVLKRSRKQAQKAA